MKRLSVTSPAIAAALLSTAMGVAPLSAWAENPAEMTSSSAASFLVFFDWGKPELGGDTKATLDKVIAAYRQEPDVHVRLEGHTDRSGSAAVNLRSARRRAAEVRSYLIANGIPATNVTIVSHGESQPLIATEDGVREVQNRRVEIFLTASGH